MKWKVRLAAGRGIFGQNTGLMIFFSSTSSEIEGEQGGVAHARGLATSHNWHKCFAFLGK
jgi:hypothetical protein